MNDARTVLRSALGNAVVEERVSKILRHSEIAVTMEVYTHVPSAETRKALRKLGKLLGGSKQGQKGKKARKPKQPKKPKEGDQDPPDRS